MARMRPGCLVRIRVDFGSDWACDLFEAWHPDLLAGHQSTAVAPGSTAIFLEERPAGPWTPTGARVVLSDGRTGWVNIGLLEVIS